MKLFLSRICRLLCLLWLGVPLASAQTITTIAGTGTAGFNSDGIAATSAQLNTPYDVVVDAQGNVFIADYNNSRVRRVDAATGTITTIAGTGVNGFNGDGGPAINARLSKVAGLFLDGAGNLFLADAGGNRIRKIDASSGDISTVAGTGTGAFGGDGAAATLAQIATPNGVVTDAAGNVYIADYANDRIRKVDAATGDISTIAGTATAGFSGDGGPANLAQISGPTGIALDAQGNLYFSDLFNNRVRKIDLAGDITTVAGTGSATFNGDGIQATNASLAGPRGLAVDSLGRLFIADATHRRIRLVDTNGVISTYAGTGTTGFSGDGGPATAAEFGFPSGVQVDSSGAVYVTDQSNHRIRRISAAPVGNPPGIVAQPQPVSQPTGSSVAFVVTANGSLPLSYQWFFTNGPVLLANGPTLSFPAAQPTNSGNYFVVITNAFGSITSAPALLTITNSTAPPALLTQPSSQTAFRSNNVALAVSATGALPLAYQWFFNSSPISAATAPSLVLTNVQPGAAGAYFVVVTNAFGSLTSSVATLTVLTNTVPPPFQWVNTIAGTSDDVSESVKVDAAGNTYLAGFFSAPISFGNTNLAPVGFIDAFVAKYDARGVCVWARSPGGRSVALDLSGNVIVSGEYFGTVAFGPTNATSAGGADIFLIKYNNAGTLLWSRQFGAAQDDNGSRTATDGAGNIYLAGDFRLTVAFGTNTFTSAGGSDFCLLKFDPAGTLLWARQAGGPGNESNARVAVDASGNPVLTGAFQGAASFGTNVLTSAGGNDGFVAKYDANGNVLWVRAAGGSGNDLGNEITADSAGNVFVTGEFTGAAIFGATNLTSVGGADAFVAKYDPTGNLVRVWQIGSPGEDRGRGVGLDAAGNQYVHGDFSGVLTYGGLSLTNVAASRDVFTLKTDGAGNAIWLKRAGSSGTDTSGNLAVALNGDVFLTGSTSNNAAFDSFTFTNAGGSDIYFTKIPANTGPLPVPPGLVGWWAGDGFAVDYASTNHGYFTNGATTVAGGEVGSAFSFAGNNAVVMPTNALNLAFSNMTIEAWVRPTSFAGGGPIWGRTIISTANTDGWAMRVLNGVLQSDLRLTGTNARFTFGSPLPLNTWSHVAITYNGSTVVGYVNGQAVGSQPATGTVMNTLNQGQVLAIGHEPDAVTTIETDNTFAWIGQLDEVSVYNRALAPTEIQTIYTAGSAGKARPATPTLLAQPQPLTVDQAAPATFRVTEIGYAPFTYQWRLNGTNVPGQTNAALTIPAAYSAHEGTYDVRVTQFDGVNLLSAPAALNVLGQGEVKTLFGTTNDVANFVRSGGGPPQWFLTASNSIQVVPGTGNIQSTQNFGDFILHAEFLLPPTGNGNSGIYLQNRYEIQIFNSFGVTVPGGNDVGAVWNQTPASTNAALPAGQWQTYDITFRQAQWNGNTKVANARVTVVLNGVTVQNETIITGPTTGGMAEGPTPGPVVLQDNGSSVQFRNIRITPLDTPPEFQRAQSFGGPLDNTLNYLATDAAANTYLAGSFEGTKVIGTNVLVSTGLFDAFVAKLNTAGTVQWARKVGGTGDESGFGVATVANGDVFFCGRFQNTASFGTTNLTASGVGDLFLARYDNNGNLIWARKAGGPGDDSAYAVAADAAGNAYVAGEFNGTTDLGGIQFVSGSASGNGFVAKYGPTGALVWASALTGTGTPTARKIRLDGATNVYVAGSFQGTIQFVTPFLSSAGSDDAYVLKLNSAGAVQWVQQFGAGASDVISALDLGLDGSVHVAGNFRGSVAFGTNTLNNIGGADMFTAKFDPAGNVLWARQAGGAGTDGAGSVGVDALGNVFVTGTFNNSATFSATPLASSGASDLFVVHYDANGIQRWVRRSSNGQSITGTELATDSTGGLLVSGEFLGSLALDAIPLSSLGQRDIFHARIASTPPVISQQPIGGNVLAGQNSTFTVGATGTGGVTYQWRLNGTNLAGATNAAYTIVNATSNAAGTYDVLVTHAFGSIASTPAVVTVTPSTNPLPVQWAATAGGPVAGENNFGKALFRNAAGDVFVAGQFIGNASFGTTNLISNGSFTDVFLAKYTATGSLVWVSQFGGSGNDEAYAVQQDAAGNLFVGGRYNASDTLGLPNLVNTGTTDGFLAKFDPQGTLLWVRQVGLSTTPGFEHVLALALDPQGNAVIAGEVLPSPTINGTNVTLTGSSDAILAKFDTTGALLWARVLGATVSGKGSGLACDAAGNIYLSGSFSGSLPTSGAPLVSAGSTDMFLAKFNAAGNSLWFRRDGGTGAEVGEDIALDPQGNLIITGTFTGTVTFGADSLVSAGGDDVFTAKYDANGSPLWARSGGGSGTEDSFAGNLTTDIVGNIYVTGGFQNTAQFGGISLTNAGSDDAFLAKYAPNGTLLWMHRLGGTGFDYFRTVDTDPTGAVFVTGTFTGSVPAGTTNLVSTGGSDMVVLKFAAIPPVITTQPASQTIGVTQPVTFSVAATGTLPVSYQWRFNGTNIAGATNAAFTIASVVPGSAGGYSVLVGDALGIATSASATLTVDTSGVPFVTTPPQSQTVQQGIAVLFNVGAVGAQPLSYQWRKNGTNLAGQNFDFLALGGTTTNDNGSYTVVVTNVFGAVTSAPAVLSVTQIFPPVITNAPASLTVVAGSNATFSVGVSGTAPFSYQWVRSGVALPGNDAPTLTVTNATPADAGSYFVQVFNSAGLATSQSQPATLTVLVPPSFLSQPQPATVLQGGFTNFVANVGGAPTPAVAWFRDGVRLTNSAGYSGVSTTNLLVFNAQAGQAGNYVVIATNAAGAITSAPVALTVLLAPAITTQPTNVLLARTNYAVVLPASLSVAATGAAPLLYQWRFNGTNLPGETNATLLLTNVTRLHNGPYQAAVSNVAGFANSSLALVRVRVPQRVEPPVFIPGQPFRLRFTDDNGEQASPEDLARIEVQAATSLIGAATVWTTLTNGFTVVNGVLQFDDPASTNQIRRYYRVIER